MNARRKTSRREFLKGKSAVEALGDLAAGEAADTQSLDRLPTASNQSSGGGSYLIQVGRKAMACEFQVFLNAGQHEGAVEAAIEALDTVDVLEDQLSIYRQESEISRLNRTAAEQAIRVESRLFQLLGRCIELSQVTGGAFDVTAAPLVKLWGFHIRQGRFPADEEIQQTLEYIGHRMLELDQRQQTVAFRKPGVEVNLGSVGKGYALDRSAEALEAAGVKNYMIHGGHSSILARGARLAGQAEATEAGWQVALRHPLRPERRLAEISLCDQGLGTSGTGQQFFYHHGRRYGHVLDPRIGRPADGVLSVTVLAPNAEQADALATAFFVMGVESARVYCQHQPDVSAVFVCSGERHGSVKLETIGLDDQLRALDMPQ